jgi:hypothetical protein
MTRGFSGEFTGDGYFALDLHQAAAYVRASTLAAKRVLKYVMELHFLFLGQRLNATAYVHDFFDAREAGST